MLLFGVVATHITFQQVQAQEIYESPNLKAVWELENLPKSEYFYGDLISAKGFVQENHGLTKVGNASLKVYLDGPDSAKTILNEISTDEFGNFSFSFHIPSEFLVGKYFLYAVPSASGYQSQIESDKKIVEFVVGNLQSLLDSPLKQYKKHNDVDKILCKDSLVLVQRYDGSPACVKPESIPKLIERGWTGLVNSIKILGTDTLINYQINGGKISSIEGNSREASGIGQITQTSLFLELDMTSNGEITLGLPRDVIDSKVGANEENFFVVIDEKEAEYTEISYGKYRTINFSVMADTKKVEIIGYGYYNDKFSNYPE